MILQNYLSQRRKFEIGFWGLFFFVQWAAQSAEKLVEHARAASSFERWEPVVWEGSSLLVLAALIPLMLHWDQRFPIRFGCLRRNLAIHILLTLPWSLLHVLGMVAIRKLAYWSQGVSYDFGNWPVEFIYEYLKDFRTYAYFLAAVYLYRFVLLRLQGEASLLDAPDVGAPAEPVERPQRLLVKKFGKEFLVNVKDIEWAEAAGNYVNLYVGERIYPLRDTMTNLYRRLDPNKFLRVHRSFLVNLDCVAEIEPLETGDARIHLRNRTQVPVSRRYREALRNSLVPSL